MMQIENFWSLWWFIFCHIFAKINFIDFIISNSLQKFEFHVHSKKAIFDNGGRIICEDMPSVYKFAESARDIPMHYRVIKQKDGAAYIGLFDSFRAMTRIFGLRVRIGLMSYTTAEKLCRIERLDGIVIGPGTKNIVIKAGNLWCFGGSLWIKNL